MKRRENPNMALKALFAVMKKNAGITSVQIASDLGVTAQTVTTMSGNLDQIKISEMSKLCMSLKVSPEDFVKSVLMRSKCKSVYNPKGV